jgi:hypothetical protein
VGHSRFDDETEEFGRESREHFASGEGKMDGSWSR